MRRNQIVNTNSSKPVTRDRSISHDTFGERESVISQLRKEEAAAAVSPETETVCSLGFLMGLLGESAERNGNRQKGGEEDRKGRDGENTSHKLRKSLYHPLTD